MRELPAYCLGLLASMPSPPMLLPLPSCCLQLGSPSCTWSARRCRAASCCRAACLEKHFHNKLPFPPHVGRLVESGPAGQPLQAIPADEPPSVAQLSGHLSTGQPPEAYSMVTGSRACRMCCSALSGLGRLTCAASPPAQCRNNIITLLRNSLAGTGAGSYHYYNCPAPVLKEWHVSAQLWQRDGTGACMARARCPAGAAGGVARSHRSEAVPTAGQVRNTYSNPSDGWYAAWHTTFAPCSYTPVYSDVSHAAPPSPAVRSRLAASCRLVTTHYITPLPLHLFPRRSTATCMARLPTFQPSLTGASPRCRTCNTSKRCPGWWAATWASAWPSTRAAPT